MKSLGVFMLFATVCVVGMGVLIYMYRAPTAAEASAAGIPVDADGAPTEWYPGAVDADGADIAAPPLSAKQIARNKCLNDNKHKYNGSLYCYALYNRPV